MVERIRRILLCTGVKTLDAAAWGRKAAAQHSQLYSFSACSQRVLQQSDKSEAVTPFGESDETAKQSLFHHLFQVSFPFRLHQY